jgi:hypothetical protein
MRGACTPKNVNSGLMLSSMHRCANPKTGRKARRAKGRSEKPPRPWADDIAPMTTDLVNEISTTGFSDIQRRERHQ